MMLKHFRTFGLAKKFHDRCKLLRLPPYATDQLLRASLSVGCNLAEGSGKITSQKEQLRFYSIALGSLRECQAILSFECPQEEELLIMADHLGACIFKLCKSKQTVRSSPGAGLTQKPN